MSIDIVWLRTQFTDINNLAVLEQGGQKTVYSGTHSSDGQVVLKVFHPNASPDRANREVQAEHSINCPRIPPVFQIGTLSTSAGSMIWVREKFITGRDLRRKLSGTSGLPPKETLGIALHILEALAAAEQARIVHRDVKPANIMCGTDGNNWLLDFGFARHLDMVSLTATGGFGMGTAGYCPVEQFRNLKNDIDARTDLFGLGITLFECVEGYNPLIRGARDQGEVLNRTESMPVVPISKSVDANGQFKDLVLAMTRTHRDQRIDSAAEALKWAQEICAKEGVT
ncbi:MAG TPA: serine/threonine-protein kinase [Fimbriiglobus sp.]